MEALTTLTLVILLQQPTTPKMCWFAMTHSFPIFCSFLSPCFLLILRSLLCDLVSLSDFWISFFCTNRSPIGARFWHEDRRSRQVSRSNLAQRPLHQISCFLSVSICSSSCLSSSSAFWNRNSCSSLEGDPRQKGKIVSEFQTNQNMQVLLLCLRTDCSGLTLVQATQVFLLEPSLSFAVEQQAISRAHRIGFLSFPHLFCRFILMTSFISSLHFDFLIM